MVNTHSDLYTQITTVFGTPLLIKGKIWLPFTQLIVWVIMTFVDRRRHPKRSFPAQMTSGGLTTLVILGSEWCHNLAHAAAARLVGKPMDEIHIQAGMPRCVYHNINDLTVTPRQHILRSLGGPFFNALSLPFWLLFKRASRPDSMAHDAAESGLAMNTFLSTASFLPIPGIDGGPLLKWSLVTRGRTPQHADAVVARVNRFSGAGLAAASALFFKKRRWLPASLCAMFAVLSWLIGYEVIKE
jgi:Zn-dependent protease